MTHPGFRMPPRLGGVALALALALGAAGPVAPVASAADSGFAYGVATNHDAFEYAVFDGDNACMSTHQHDYDRIKKLGRKYGGDNFWFALDGREYLVHDPAVVNQAKRIIQPMQELGERQGRLGEEQSRIGSQQSAIGARQAEIGARMSLIAARITRLSVRSAAYGSAEDDRQVQSLQRDLDRLQAEQEALQKRQQPFAEQQQKLGAKQEALGKQQEKASKTATRELEALARQTVQAGKAERVQ